MMDEARKKRITAVWLGILYISLWTLAVAAALIAVTWLLGLWRYAAFAAIGIAVGAYLSGRADSIVERITQAVLAVAAAIFAGYLMLAIARSPALLVPFGLATGTILLYAASTVATVRFVQAILRMITASRLAAPARAMGETPVTYEESARSLEVVPEDEVHESDTTPVPAGQ